jgi:hypothetical protein
MPSVPQDIIHQNPSILMNSQIPRGVILMNEHMDFLTWLKDLKTIRTQSQRMLELARHQQLEDFFVVEAQLETMATFVIDVIQSRYPNLNIPYHSRWRHFEACNIHLIQDLLKNIPQQDHGKVLFELSIISVLLDAGAGERWRFQDITLQKQYTRSEGLALASLKLYQQGAFSSQKDPFRVDASRLLSFHEDEFKQGFQVTDDNPLNGISGRIALIHQLGETIISHAEYFGDEGRLGDFFVFVASSATPDKTLSANTLFSAVLNAFQPIWPTRLIYDGTSLGDVWTHHALKTSTPGSEYIPFHKLSQWLCYSLIEPLEHMGITVTDMDLFTALPEYRNGGLLIDTGVLVLKNKARLLQAHEPGSELVVAWRALTVALIDILADMIRTRLKKSQTSLPLAKILQGGTWEAGRQIALTKRSFGVPPLQIISDGTVF